jgi:hypothetical protein
MSLLLQTGSAGPREHTRMGIARKKMILVKKTSLPALLSTFPLASCANAQPAAQKSIGSGQIILRRTFCVLLILQCLAVVTRADISKQDLQKWVDDSTLVFKGTIVSLDSNVDSIDASDKPITVRVDEVELATQQAQENFGSLVGKQLTAIWDPTAKGAMQRRVGISAVFFVNPLLYEKNIAVSAVGVADNQTVKNLPKRLSAAIEEKKKKPLITALKGADRVVTGVVEEIKVLPDEKLAGLRLLANGYDLYSEHSPRWREALIRVQSVLKGDQSEKMLIVIFPSTEDLMWANSPKFKKEQTGTWLLHSGTQLSPERAKILLTPEQFHGQPIRAYTALQPEDFRPKDPTGTDEKLIRQMLKSLK